MNYEKPEINELGNAASLIQASGKPMGEGGLGHTPDSELDD